MNKLWWKLKEYENESYIEFIMGQRDLSEFSLFVKQWQNDGGNQILKEVEKQINQVNH